MESNIVVWAAILIGAVLVLVGGYYGLPKLRSFLAAKGVDSKTQGMIDQVLYLAIMAAFRAEQKAASEFGAWLKGVEKKRIADSVYDLFTKRYATTAIGKFLLDSVSRETFAEWVQDAYDNFVNWYDGNKEHFEQMIQDFAEANAP